MVMLSVGALLLALAADPPAETGERGSAQPADANRAAGNAQQSSRDTAGGDERTGPPAPGIQSGDANGMAGGRTDQGPRGGAGIREGGDRLRKDRARARASGQARGRNRKGSFERPADAPADMNRDPKPMGSGAPADPDSLVTEWSVEPAQYGEFLCAVFDEWVRHDVGKTFVQLFDVALGNWMGLGSALCFFAEKCGHALAIEHNGDVYSCDHYVYPKYHLGNIMNRSLGEMVQSPQQTKFGNDKLETLPQYCRDCEVRFACNGECPKHRFIKTPDGEDGLNYLCAAYKRFFNHVDPYMQTMSQLLNSRRPAAMIMDMLREQRQTIGSVGRNEPCPCGSGKKYKKCWQLIAACLLKQLLQLVIHLFQDCRVAGIVDQVVHLEWIVRKIVEFI